MSGEGDTALVAGLSERIAAIAAASTLEDLAVIAIDEVRRVIDAEYIAFYVVEPGNEALRMFAQHGFSPEEAEEAERTAHERHPGAVVRSRERLHVADIQADSSASPGDQKRRHAVRSRLFLPIESEGQCIGTLGMASSEPDHFSPLHIEILDFLCRFVGVTHRNLWRLKELEHRLSELTEQQRTMQELSAPISEIEPGILVAPIIGRVDATRAEILTQRLLEVTAERRARVVLLDLTGLSADEGATPFIERTIKSLALLGTHCLLSGITPAVAQSAVAHGVDMPAGRSFASLHRALIQARGLLGRA